MGSLANTPFLPALGMPLRTGVSLALSSLRGMGARGEASPPESTPVLRPRLRPGYTPGRCSRSTSAGGAAQPWGPWFETRSPAVHHLTGSRIFQGNIGGEGQVDLTDPGSPQTTDMVLPSLEEHPRAHRRVLGCGPYLGKALRLVSRYSLRPFCTRSSSLLQSLRLSSSLWSAHTLITCRNQTQPGRESGSE